MKMRRPIVIIICSTVVAMSLLGWWLVSCYPTFKDVPRLIKELGDEDPAVRVKAAANLQVMGPDAKEAVPALIEALDDEVLEVRVTVAEALGRIGNEPGVVQALTKAMDDKKKSVRMVILDALFLIGPEPDVVIAFIEATNDKEDAVRLYALGLLGDFGPDARDAIPPLMEKLKNREERLRPKILNALGRMGPEPLIIETMINSLGDEERGVRFIAVHYLGYYGNISKDAVPSLIEILNNEMGDDHLRAETIVTLGKIGPEPGVADALLDAIWDETISVYRGAFEALGNLGDEPKVIQALIEVLQSDDPERPMHAAYTLGRIGPKAEPAIPALIECADDERIYLRRAIMHALGDISPKAGIVPTLIKGLNDIAPEVRRDAAVSVGKVGPEAVDAVPVLLDNLGDGRWVRLETARALDRINADYNETTVPVLIELLDEEDALRALAALELAYIGPGASDALPELKAIIDETPLKHTAGKLTYPPSGFHPDVHVMSHKRMYIACAYAVAMIEQGNEQALYILIQGLGDDYHEIRRYSAEALGELGSHARPALPALEEIASNKLGNLSVREAAESAINKIQAQ